MPKHLHSRRRAHTSATVVRMSALSLGLFLALPALAQESTPATPVAKDLDAIQVIGTRVRGRTAEETAAPVDVISNEELNATGAMEIGQILQTLEPSFNFSRTRGVPRPRPA